MERFVKHLVNENDYTLSIELQPQETDLRFLEDSLNSSNIQITGIPFGGDTAIFIRDRAHQIVGGVNGWKWGDAFEIGILWIREDLRGLGYGTKLLQTLEAQALAQACSQVLLDTYSFQAIGFYQKFGYQTFGVLENFPTGYTRYFLRKQLSLP